MTLASHLPILAALLSLALPGSAAAQSPNILGFDDLTGTAAVPAGYGGIVDWGSWESTDVSDPDFPFAFSLAHIRSVGPPERIDFGGPSFFGGALVITKAPMRWKGYRLGQLVATSATLAPNLGGPAVLLGFDSTVVIDELEIETSGRHGVDDFTWIPAGLTGSGFSYCTSSPNSTGQAALITAAGQSSVAANDVTLVASNIPPGQFGIFITSAGQAFVPLGNGTLCVGGSADPIGRFVGPGQVQAAAPDGILTLSIDLTALPVSAFPTAVQPGDTWNFQAWFRDQTGAGYDFTNGTSLFFTP